MNRRALHDEGQVLALQGDGYYVRSTLPEKRADDSVTDVVAELKQSE